MKTSVDHDPYPAEKAGDTIEAVRKAAADCHACPLWKNATQTVFGEGPSHAPIMLVGEQPGDQEDLMGRPFVGPAGRILAQALASSGIPREKVYVTNAVKHFKFELRGKRRLHKKPVDSEIVACNQWLRREIELVTPRLLVALGATAARALLGRTTPIGINRGRIREYASNMALLITVHPSFLLRVPEENKDEEYEEFEADIKLAKSYLRPV